MNATAKDDFNQGPNYIILDQCNKFEEYVCIDDENCHHNNPDDHYHDQDDYEHDDCDDRHYNDDDHE